MASVAFASLACLGVAYLLWDTESSDSPVTQTSSHERVGSKPYDQERYQSELLAPSRNRHVWGLEEKEIEWATAAGALKVVGVRPGSRPGAQGREAADLIWMNQMRWLLFEDPAAELASIDPPQTPGFEIAQIIPGSLMETLGLRPGDIVLSVNDRVVYPRSDLENVLKSQSKGVGRKLRIVLDRAGELIFYENDAQER